ncbi:MAG: hypothetical protein ACLR71_16090 [[Clostridium] scindens]
MAKKNTEARAVWTVIMLIFMVFLAFPLILLLLKSFQADGGISWRTIKRSLLQRILKGASQQSGYISAGSGHSHRPCVHHGLYGQLYQRRERIQEDA